MSARLAAVLTLAGVLSACPSSPSTGAHALHVMGPLSMEAPFRAAAPAFEAAHPGVHLVLGFAPSPVLVDEIVQGQRVDVVVTADESTMRTLSAAHLVGKAHPLAENHLVVVVPVKNPAHVASVQDLARPGMKVLLAAERVPGGHFARAALAGLSLLDDVKKNLMPDAATVAAACQTIGAGGADAGIAYQSDVAAAAGALSAIPLPQAADVVVTYPIAVLTASTEPALAQAFIDALGEGPGAAAMSAAGFVVHR